jgi:hypothetical protein
MAWQEWREVRLAADSSNTWTTTAVGDCESLVKIQMADISSDGAWRS